MNTLAAASLLALTLFAGTPALAAGPSEAELQMAEAAPRFRQFAEVFIARAGAGDLEASRALLSPALVRRMGDELVQQVLRTQILPFFQAGAGLAGSATVSRTTDADGHSGYAFHLWLMQRDGSGPRPFSLYVVEEGGRLVLANVVPNRAIEGRHR